MDTLYLALDIETVPDLDAELPVPTPAKNLKDPDKIAADVRAKLEAQRDKMALDPWCSRPIVITTQRECDDVPQVMVAADDDALIDALSDVTRMLWAPDSQRRTLLGFRLRTFDWPHLTHHARRLGVPWPVVDLRRYGNAYVTDLYDLLCDDECEHVISRSLKSTCRIYGIDVPATDIDGADVAAAIAAGDLDAVVTHCARDVARTVALARRVGVIAPARRAQEVA